MDKNVSGNPEFVKEARRLLALAAAGDGEAFSRVRYLCEGDAEMQQHVSGHQFVESRISNCLKLKSGVLKKPDGLLYHCLECEAALCAAYPVARRWLCQEDQDNGVLLTERYCMRVLKGTLDHKKFDRELCVDCEESSCDLSLA